MRRQPIGAAYGVVVALFNWGWLSDLTGVTPGPIEPWVPMMLFAIVFIVPLLVLTPDTPPRGRSLAECVRSGGQALILMPEIALTAQFLDRFAARFGVRPGAWHSGIGGRRRERLLALGGVPEPEEESS